MPAEFKIRIATGADAEAIRSLWQSVDELHRVALPSLFRTPPDTWPADDVMDKMIAGPDSSIHVAELEGRVVGFITLLLHNCPETPIRPRRTVVEIDNMAVDAAIRRRGVGRALLTSAKDWATQRGAGSLDLNVYAFNDEAARLYEAFGFTPILHRLTTEV